MILCAFLAVACTTVKEPLYKDATCLKHFAGYAASEAGMDYVYTEVSDQTLWDTYLPPFEAGIKAGAATLMSGFHNLSATPVAANRFLITEVLKNRWGHEGYVVSDWGSIKTNIAETGADVAAERIS